MYGARNNFHGAVDHPTSTNNISYPTNGCNGNSVVNGARFNQHVPAISRSVNTQNDHHRHQPHTGIILRKFQIRKIEKFNFCFYFDFVSNIITSSSSITTF